jgi:CBS domain-containing protein
VEKNMQVKNCMKQNVFTITPATSIRDAASIIAQRHIGSLPVVDSQGKLVGLLQLSDLLEIVLPDFLKLLDDFDFAPNFGAVETRQPTSEILVQPVSKIMQEPVSIDAESGLLRAFSLLHKYRLHDLPVVDAQGKLVGIVSRVDVGAAFLSGWSVTQGG